VDQFDDATSKKFLTTKCTLRLRSGQAPGHEGSSPDFPGTTFRSLLGSAVCDSFAAHGPVSKLGFGSKAEEVPQIVQGRALRWRGLNWRWRIFRRAMEGTSTIFCGWAAAFAVWFAGRGGQARNQRAGATGGAGLLPLGGRADLRRRRVE